MKDINVSTQFCDKLWRRHKVKCDCFLKSTSWKLVVSLSIIFWEKEILKSLFLLNLNCSIKQITNLTRKGWNNTEACRNMNGAIVLKNWSRLVFFVSSGLRRWVVSWCSPISWFATTNWVRKYSHLYSQVFFLLQIVWPESCIDCHFANGF